MLIFDHAMQKAYEKEDRVLEFLNATCRANDSSFTSHRWLLDSLPKRMIYQFMYGDLLRAGSERRRILDVGGGYCSLTRGLLERHEYTLLDIMAHDSHKKLRAIEESLSKHFWIQADWNVFRAQNEYALIIANDLFPNVDQRLELFIEKFLPFCCEMRLSLTYYNSPRFYLVKRMDANEVLCLLAWDGIQTRQVMEKYITRIKVPKLELLLQDRPSLFANGRQVCVVRLQGDRRL